MISNHKLKKLKKKRINIVENGYKFFSLDNQKNEIIETLKSVRNN